MKILIADDHALLRKSVARQLSRLDPKFEIEEAHSIAELMSRVESTGYHPPYKWSPVAANISNK